MDISKLEPQEKAEAIKILASLGLTLQEAEALQGIETEKRVLRGPPIVEYIHRRETACLLCKTTVACYFKMLQKGKQHVLTSVELSSSKELLNNELEIRTTKIQVLTCKNCRTALNKLSKGELIQALIASKRSFTPKRSPASKAKKAQPPEPRSEKEETH